MDASQYHVEAETSSEPVVEDACETETTPVFRKGAPRSARRLNLIAQASGNLPPPRSR
jgi:hypothetical protein